MSVVWPISCAEGSVVLSRLLKQVTLFVYFQKEWADIILLLPRSKPEVSASLAPIYSDINLIGQSVARLVSDVLTRNRHQPEFEISVLPCSITYMYFAVITVPQYHDIKPTYRHRQHFRSDVLVTFHPPMIFTPKVFLKFHSVSCLILNLA